MTLRTLALIGALTLLPALASAQSDDTGTAPIKIEFGYTDTDGDFTPVTREIDQKDYMNAARCQCGAEMPDADTGAGPGTFQVRLTYDSNLGTLDPGERAELTVGSRCADANSSERDCEPIQTIDDPLNALRSPTIYNIQLDRFMFPDDGAADSVDVCPATTGERGVYVLFDNDADGDFEKQAVKTYAFDTQPPPLPVAPVASPAEGAVQLRWDAPSANQSDVQYYQVLCARADGSPAFATPTDEALYDTAPDLCGSGVGVPIEAGGGTGPDGGTQVVDAGAGGVDAGGGGGFRASALPAGLTALDPAYVCGTAGESALSMRVDGLENGQAYYVVLLSIDDARNVAAQDMGMVTPEQVTDFWEDYQNQGGSAEGGVCLVTSTFGDGDPMTRALRDFRDGTLARSAAGRALIDIYYAHVAPLGVHAERHVAVRAAAAVVLAPLAGLAAFWEYTGALAKLLALGAIVLLGVGLRRPAYLRRALRCLQRHDLARYVFARPGKPAGALGAAAGLALLLIGSPGAAAQPDPYWDAFEPVEARASQPADVPYWNIGIKVGPYVPGVDSSVAAAPGPYERTYGGAALMGMVELDRYFLWPMGQLGVTASAGYASKTANAFLDDGSTGERSEGDKTSFRVMPLSAGVAYRFTALDDRWRIPLVPYGRVGLAYYLWWVTAPSGAIAKVPTAECPDLNGCSGNRALGASLGWQASVGLAFRAERLDPQAEMSLRNDLGIEHAGLYAELVHADVDGFGSDSRLPVGDTTWFAGLNFEF